MIKWSGIALLVLGVAHIIILGIDALPFGPGWLRLGLWKTGHWLPFATQRPNLPASNAGWATLWQLRCSFNVP